MPARVRPAYKTHMSTPLRYILVGTGGRGLHWCAHVLPRLAQLNKAVPVAAVDLLAERLDNAQSHLGLAPAHCFTSAAEAFEKRRADFAILVVPGAAHEKLIDLALTFDLHILCEPPVALTMDAIQRIQKKVNVTGKKMAVAMSQRFDQDKQTLIDLVRHGGHGRPNYIVTRFTANLRSSPAWGRHRHEMDDPVLMEAAVQHLDVQRELAGDSAKAVYGASWRTASAEYAGDTTLLLMLEMLNGVQCLYEASVVNASTLNGWDNEYIRVECDRATIELDQRRLRIITGGAIDAPRIEQMTLKEQPACGAAAIAEKFCDWLAGSPPPPCTLADAAMHMQTIFAAAESAVMNKPVEIAEFVQRHAVAP